MDNIDKLDEAQARLDELSKATLGRYIKGAHIDKARHEKASHNMNIARRAIDDISYSSAVRNIKQPEGEKASHEVLNHAGAIMRKAARKHDDKAFNRKIGIHKAMSRLTKEDIDLQEQAAELNELSKNTVNSYINKAIDSSKKLYKKSVMANAKSYRAYQNGDYDRESNLLDKRDRFDAKKIKRDKFIDLAKSKISKAKIMATEDIDLQEQAAELNELSKNTLRSYTSKATDSVAGRGRKSAKKLNRLSNIELAKQKLHSILDKEHAAREKQRNAHASDIQQHFLKEAPKVLAKHGYTKVNEVTGKSSVYHKAHNTGHSTLVRIAHPNSTYNGSNFSINSTTGSGTLNGHNHVIDHSETAEENKTKMMNRFENHLINHHDDHKRWLHEEVDQTGEVLEEGRRGRPPKDPTKRAAFNSAESDEPGMHIIAQLNKVKVSSTPIKVHFKDGTKHELHPNHAEHILAKYSGMKPNEKIDFQKRIAQSHASLKNELK